MSIYEYRCFVSIQNERYSIDSSGCYYLNYMSHGKFYTSFYFKGKINGLWFIYNQYMLNGD